MITFCYIDNFEFENMNASLNVLINHVECNKMKFGDNVYLTLAAFFAVGWYSAVVNQGSAGFNTIDTDTILIVKFGVT